MTAAREYLDKENLPSGMSHFARWFSPCEDMFVRSVSPTDGDFLLHNSRDPEFPAPGKFLLGEFKPSGHPVTVGQKILLEAFSRQPNSTSFLVGDPFAHDRSGSEMDNSTSVGVVVWLAGLPTKYNLTLAELNSHINDWWVGSNRSIFYRERTNHIA